MKQIFFLATLVFVLVADEMSSFKAEACGPGTNQFTRFDKKTHDPDRWMIMSGSSDEDIDSKGTQFNWFDKKTHDPDRWMIMSGSSDEDIDSKGTQFNWFDKKTHDPDRWMIMSGSSDEDIDSKANQFTRFDKKTHDPDTWMSGSSDEDIDSKGHLQVKFGTLCAGNPTNERRQCDSFGCGSFGASRGGRNHTGLDIVCADGKDVFAPFDVKIEGVAVPYVGRQRDTINNGLKLRGEGLCFKLFYVKPVKTSGTVKKEEQLGTMLPMQKVYPKITSHVHVQMCDKSDPTPYFQ